MAPSTTAEPPTKRRKVTGKENVRPRRETFAVVIPVEKAMTPLKKKRSPITPVKAPQATVEALLDVTPTKYTPVKALSNVYAHARSLLRLSSEQEGPLLGRDKERTALLDFLASRYPSLFPEHIVDEAVKGASLYISGLPGTGKTALLMETVGRLRADELKVDMVNCLSLQQPSDVWRYLVEAPSSASPGALRELAEGAMSDYEGRRLLVLDEADRLVQDGAKQNHLFQLFALAREHPSKLTIIAIANSLDLRRITDGTDDLPTTIHFPPYDSASLVAIANQRLSHLSPSYDGTSSVIETKGTPLFDVPALKLLALKVQKQSGDLRSFLSLLRSAISLAETDALKSTPSTPSSSDKLSCWTPTTAPRVTLRHARSACDTYGVKSSLSDPLTAALTNGTITLDGRLLLTCLALFASLASSTSSTDLKKKNRGGLDLTEAFASYEKMMKKAGGRRLRDSLLESEWRLMIENLDVAGVLRTGAMTTSSSSSSPPSSASSKKRGGRKVVNLAFEAARVLEAVKGVGKEGECALATTVAWENRVRKRMEWEGDAEAPRAGFHGDGLEGRQTFGVKRAHEDDDEEGC